MANNHSNDKIEYGDFQTPDELSDKVCQLLFADNIRPSSVLDPTCGSGSFLISSIKTFNTIKKIIGVDINPKYIDVIKNKFSNIDIAEVFVGNFFELEWNSILKSLPEPILIIGNPPWVTNAGISTVNGTNLPEKSNFLKFSGFDALTGKSNFDISEWMLIKMLDWMYERDTTIAMLCKTTVARKIVVHGFSNERKLESAAYYSINAKRYFGAMVDACLLVLKSSIGEGGKVCFVYDGLDSKEPSSVLGFENDKLIANINYYEKWQHLQGVSQYRWRSGIKHDCTSIMELKKVQGGFINGLGETVDLELDYLYPMLKSSDIAKSYISTPKKWMLVTQKSVGEKTDTISEKAPKTWQYLISHASYLEGRKSSIYKNKPRFSIFGVGDYSFASWKVVISGLYKRLHFSVVGPHEDKPVVLDDTCYFIACSSEKEAELIYSLLNSSIARDFFNAFIFWDAKRPITTDILNRLDILLIARELNQKDEVSIILQDKELS